MRVCQEPARTVSRRQRSHAAPPRRNTVAEPAGGVVRQPRDPGSCSGMRGSTRAHEGAAAAVFELGTLINWRSPLAIAFLSVDYLSRSKRQIRPCLTEEPAPRSY